MSKVARITNDGKLLLADELIEETHEPANNIELDGVLGGWSGGYTTNPETSNIYYVKGLRSGFMFPQAIFEVGETYTLSFKIMKTSGDILSFGGHTQGFEDVEVYLDDELIGNSWSEGLEDTYPNDNLEHNYKVILTFNGSAVDSNLYVQINRDNGYATEYTAEIYDLKLEKMNEKIPNLSLGNTGDMVIIGDLIELDNKFKVNQILENGDFRNGLQGWNFNSVQNDSIIIENGILKFTTDGTTPSAVNGNLDLNHSLEITHKYYGFANVKYIGTMRLKATTYLMEERENNGEWIKLSGLITSNGTFNRPFGIVIMDKVPTDVEVKDLFLINLTETFGEGNEPSKDDCDKMFSNYYQNGGYAELINDNIFRLKGDDILVNELIEGVDF